VWLRTKGEFTGRDGCRVPIPWSGTEPSYGFGPSEASWLPQPPEWSQLSVASQRDVAESTLELYRRVLAQRRAEPSLGEGPMAWLDAAPENVLALRRFAPDHDQPEVLVVINTGDTAAHLPSDYGTDVVVASGPDVAVVSDDDGEYLALGAATAVWLRG